MREYVTFSVDVENCVADLTPASRKLVDEWVAMGDIWAADVLKDISGISEQAYKQSLEAMAKEWQRHQAKNDNG